MSWPGVMSQLAATGLRGSDHFMSLNIAALWPASDPRYERWQFGRSGGSPTAGLPSGKTTGWNYALKRDPGERDGLVHLTGLEQTLAL